MSDRPRDVGAQLVTGVDVYGPHKADRLPPLTATEARRLAMLLLAGADLVDPPPAPTATGGPPPYGWTRPAGYVPEVAELETVERIRQLYADDGLGYRAIASELNRQGILSRHGGQWSAATVRRIVERSRFRHAA